VVGVRGLLHDRAVLDRWVIKITTGLRTAMEEWVAVSVLAAEASLGRSAAERDAVEAADMDEALARIDRDIREYMVQRARAGAVRDRRAPGIGRALAAVQAELDRSKPPIMAF
jgi:transposase